MREAIWSLNRITKTEDPYLGLMSEENVAKALRFHRSIPQYSVTPLAELKHLAEYLGILR